MRFIPFALLCAVAVPGFAADAPAPVALQYHLAPQNNFAFQTLLKVDGEARSNGAAQPDTVSAQIEMKQDVRVASTESKTGNFVLENRLTQLKLTNNGKVTSADSAPLITTVIRPDGKLVEIRGLEQLASANALPGLDPTTFGSLLYSFPTFPGRSVKPGESWNDELPVPLPTGQNIQAKRKLTLLSVGAEKDGRASATIKIDLTLPIDVKIAGDAGGTLTGTQTGVGECRVLLSDGLPLEMRNDVTMEIVVTPTKSAGADPSKPDSGSARVTTRIHIEAKRVPSSVSNSAAPDKATVDSSNRNGGQK